MQCAERARTAHSINELPAELATKVRGGGSRAPALDVSCPMVIVLTDASAIPLVVSSSE